MRMIVWLYDCMEEGDFYAFQSIIHSYNHTLKFTCTVNFQYKSLFGSGLSRLGKEALNLSRVYQLNTSVYIQIIEYRRIKRIFDAALAFILLLLLFIPLLFLSLIIFIQTKQNPVFIQERGLSLNKNRFNIYKLRTLKNDLNVSEDNNISFNLNRTFKQNFIYPFGQFLRKTGIDELPQLINILRGEMTFVGPRPFDIQDLENIKKNYPGLYKKREKFNLKPGLTGYWQINKDTTGSINCLFELDKHYFLHQSFSFDIKIIFLSMLLAVRGKHKDSIVYEKTAGTSRHLISCYEIYKEYGN